jgi:pimeloyl-ACP methyl ester carboxylesterase
MTGLSHRRVDVGGVELHVAEQGSGPLVVLLHGFPECWYSWRHQFGALALAGYRVVAPDLRGYARSSRPADVADYTMMHLSGDVIGLVHALGEERAVLVGHDWGAPIAWATAQMRPDVVRGVAGLSVPPVPRGTTSPLTVRRTIHGESFYQVYFQQQGAADREFAANPRSTFRTLLYWGSGDNPVNSRPRPWAVSSAGTLLDTMHDPAVLPSWLSEDDVDVFFEEFSHQGDSPFTGGLNYYRNLDRNWVLSAPFSGAPIAMPSLFITGDRDLVRSFPGVRDPAQDERSMLPGLTATVVLPGCGHWTQQERPDEVNAALLTFLGEIDARSCARATGVPSDRAPAPRTEF